MRLRWVAFWAMAGVAAVILSSSLANEYRHQKKLQSVLAERNSALAKAQDKLDRMRERADFYKTEEGQAWIAREKLNMAFSGEEIYRIEE